MISRILEIVVSALIFFLIFLFIVFREIIFSPQYGQGSPSRFLAIQEPILILSTKLALPVKVIVSKGIDCVLTSKFL